MTRSYSILSEDSTRTDLQWAVDYEVEKFFDLRALWRGQALEQNEIENIKIIANDYNRTDLLPNPLSITIASDRLLDILSPSVNQGEIQVFSAPIYSATTGQRISGYHIINPLRVLDALTPQCVASNPLITQLEVQAAQIPESLCVFRVAGQPGLFVISKINRR